MRVYTSSEYVREYEGYFENALVLNTVRLIHCLWSRSSLRSVFLQKKQDFAENTANRVRELTNQMQEWCQRVQAEPSTHSQVKLNVFSIFSDTWNKLLLINKQKFQNKCKLWFICTGKPFVVCLLFFKICK